MKKLHTDRIAIMSDDEINTHVAKIKNLLTYKNKRENKFGLEIELCYLQRESFIRNNRKKAHEKFLSDRGITRRFKKPSA